MMAAISNCSYTRTKLNMRVSCALVYLGGKRVAETSEQIIYTVHSTVFQ